MTTDAATRSGLLPRRPPARRRGLLVRLLVWAAVLWHGMHLPAAAHGGPRQQIDPGTTWAPSWTIDQPAATLWYHPHLHRATENHVYRGLAGLFLLEDREASALPLPNRYGVDDIPVVLQDKRFGADGNLDFGESPFSAVGRLGDQMLVNGTHDPHVGVGSQRVRSGC